MIKLKQILNEQSDSPTVIHTNLYNRYRITDPKIINLLETFAQLYVEIVEEAGKNVTLIHSYEIPDILKDNTTNMTSDDYNLVKKNTWFLFDRALEITRTKE